MEDARSALPPAWPMPPGDASLSGEQPPRIALVPRSGSDPAIVVVWTEKTPDGTRLLSARSDDAGEVICVAGDGPGQRGAWQPWLAVHCHRAATGRRRPLAGSSRALAARESGASKSHAEHQHLAPGQKPGDGVARAQLSKLIFARLRAGQPGYRRPVCGATVADRDHRRRLLLLQDRDRHGLLGAVYAAWRHVYEGNVRDIAFTKSPDGGRSFAQPLRVSDDRWVLDGCPENGPAMAVDTDKRIHIVWPTLVPGAAAGSEPTLALFYATSTDGRLFTTRQRVPTRAFRGTLKSPWDLPERQSSHGMNRPEARDGLRWLVEQSRRRSCAIRAASRSVTPARAPSTR